MKVWVTRDEKRDGPLCEALRAEGLHALWEPVLRRRAVDTWDGAIVDTLGTEDWLVLTSPFAIECLARFTNQREPRVAVVGEMSQRLATACGFRVAVVSGNGTSAGLFAELKRRVQSGRICYPRSSLAGRPNGWGGVAITSPVLYETVARDYDRSVGERADIIAVASASAVGAVGRVSLPFASIGPSTTMALRDMGIKPALEAPDRSFVSLAAAIAAYANDSRQDRA